MTTPFISICIAACHAEKFIESALRTVQAQTLKDWEIIVVEDGSHDRTGECMQEFSTTAPQNIVFTRHPIRQGLAAARNTAAGLASGDWIVFLDAEDLWKPEHLETLVSASQIEQADIIYSGAIEYDHATWTKLSTHSPADADLKNLAVALYTGRLALKFSQTMIRREALGKYGPVSTLYSACSDTEYWLRVLSRKGSLLFSGANTCILRHHEGSPTRKVALHQIESARICEQYANWQEIPRLISRTRTASLYRSAGRALLAENPNEALSPLSRSLRLVPLNPATIGLWTRAFFRQGLRQHRAA